MRLNHAPARAEEFVRAVEVPREIFVDPGHSLQPRLHLGLQGGQLGLVAALALFGEGLQGLSLALVGLLAQGVALLHDPDVELELLLALLLTALEPAAEDLQEGGASSESGETGDGAVHELAHAGGSRDLQAVAGGEGEIDLHCGLLRKRTRPAQGTPGGKGHQRRFRAGSTKAVSGSWTRSGLRSSMTSMSGGA